MELNDFSIFQSVLFVLKSELLFAIEPGNTIVRSGSLSNRVAIISTRIPNTAFSVATISTSL